MQRIGFAYDLNLCSTVILQSQGGGFYLSRNVLHAYEEKLRKVSNNTHYVKGGIRTPFFYLLYQMSEKASIVSRKISLMPVNLESGRNVLLLSSCWWLKVKQHWYWINKHWMHDSQMLKKPQNQQGSMGKWFRCMWFTRGCKGFLRLESTATFSRMVMQTNLHEYFVSNLPVIH